MINAGRLRKRVTIQQSSLAGNTYGEQTKTWTTFKQVWAAVEPLQGREFWAGQQVQNETTYRVRIRYLAGVVPQMRILYGTKVLNIQQIINPQERNIELQLMCSEGVIDA